ncbi:MAG TPA: hypothetical protein GXX66_00905 [Acholeplasmataceae bacterium]|nr:hypothetical protein [Acholeplasmataceae bacterium]
MNKYYELLKEKEYQKIKEEAIIKNDLDLDYLIVLISTSFKTNEFVILYYYLSKTNFKKEIEDGGANYTNYLNIIDEKQQLALVLTNFSLGVIKEKKEQEIDDDYLNYRVIDLLNILFEIGYEDEVLNKIYHLLMSVE